jgi:hypothetical protein
MRPNGSDLRRQGVPHFFNFTGCDLFRQKLKHSRNRIRREKQGIGLEGAVDARDESALWRCFTGVAAGRQCS